jgi:hypothetical protein
MSYISIKSKVINSYSFIGIEERKIIYLWKKKIIFFVKNRTYSSQQQDWATVVLKLMHSL